jgi:hypothetical protein
LVSHFEGGTQTEGFSRSLRRVFGPKSEEDGSWRKFRNDELHSLYPSQNIVRVIKARRRGGTCDTHGGGEVFTGFWLAGSKVRDHWEDLGVCGKITLS